MHKAGILRVVVCVEVLIFLIAPRVGMAEQSNEWVQPTYETGEFVEKHVEVEKKIAYQSRLFKQPANVMVIDKAQEDYSNPVSAFISRMSAIINLDYDWWINTLDPVSRKLAQDKYAEEGLTEAYWKTLWRAQFSDSKVRMIRKINTEGYVIVTYKIFSKAGKDISGGFEMPSVYKKIGNRWFATMDLRANPLLQYSPWVSGKNETIIELDFR